MGLLFIDMFMIDVYICDVICIFIGCYGGVLKDVCVDDFGVVLFKVLIECNCDVDWVVIDDVVYGCVN